MLTPGASRRARGILVLVAVTTASACAAIGGSDTPPVETPRARFAPPAPVVEADAAAPTGIAGFADPAWITRVSAGTGIPQRALRAYAGAAINSNRENPGCAASWNTLAGIGRVESHHGEIFGGTIDSSGLVSPSIFGVPLDGIDVADIPDSDGGSIDGDATIDRAVGPMQLIPESWRNWHVDGSGDGIEDPQNIDDAALAAVHYLCRAGVDLSTEDGWSTAILAWNRSDAYLEDVASWANRYGTDAADG